jgi:hypothetical protein
VGCFQDFNRFLEGGGGSGATGGGGSDACEGVVCDDDNPCTQDICDVDGTCLHPAAEVVTLPQVDGDCKENQCDGTELVEVADPGDLPIEVPADCKQPACNGTTPGTTPDINDVPVDDGNVCTTEQCTAAGEPETVNNTLPCGRGDMFQCANGTCSCNDAADCTDFMGPCAMPTCEMSACVPNYLAAGTQVGDDGTDGNCLGSFCNGMTHTAMVGSDPADVPADDANPCTTAACVNDVPTQANVPADTACPGNNQCDGMGACVDCTTNAGCGGGTPNCNTAINTCVECTADGQCATNPDGADCLVTNLCGCDMQSDCAASEPCVGSVCGCVVNGDCSGFPTAPNCNAATGLCVECTADGQCAANPDGADCLPTNLCGCDMQSDCAASEPCVGSVCGCVVNGDCSGFPTAPNCNAATGLCVECTADGQCAANPDGSDCLPTNLCGCDMQSDCPTNEPCQGSACGCTTNMQCMAAFPMRPLCDTAQGDCQECLNNGDCTSSTKGRQCLPSGTCGCTTSNPDCNGVGAPGGPTCNTTTNLCGP